MTIRFASLLFTVIALTAVAAGCGSSSSDESSGTQASTATAGKGSEGGAGSPEKEAFVKQASAACTKARESSFERIGGKGQKAGAGEAEVTITAVLLGALRAEVAAIRSLTPPAEDQSEMDEIVTELEATLHKAESMKGASPEEIEALFAGTDKQLEAYGLSACSKSA